MKTLSVSAAKARFNDLVDQAVTTHEQITITRNGSPVTVMVAADEWESMQETLFWLSQPGLREDLAEAESAHSADTTVSGEEIRKRYGLTQHSTPSS